MRKYKTARGVLYGMLQRYKKYGWTQGNFSLKANDNLPDQCHCIGGAMQYAVTGNSCGHVPLELEQEVLKLLGFCNRDAMYRWNDRDAVSTRQVVERIQAAYNKVKSHAH